MIKKLYCESCGATMKPVYKNMCKKEGVVIYKCKQCLLIRAPELDIDSTFTSQLNENKRKEAIEGVRNTEFHSVISLLQQYLTSGKGLEVGCSYGWFMEQIQNSVDISRTNLSDTSDNKYLMEGIEAEDAIAEQARKKGLNVYTGLFPMDMPSSNSKYDFIVFNNVWEHINNTDKLIIDCKSYLKNDGYLLITVPLSSGILYKISEVFEKLGRSNELTRLWQLHFHSPHIYFFTKKNISALMKKHRFKLVESKDIRSIDANKMKVRFEMDNSEKNTKLKALLFRLIWPLLKRMPADKAVFLYKYDERLK